MGEVRTITKRKRNMQMRFLRITYALVTVRISNGVPYIISVRRRPLIRVKKKIVERSKVSNKLRYVEITILTLGERSVAKVGTTTVRYSLSMREEPASKKYKYLSVKARRLYYQIKERKS